MQLINLLPNSKFLLLLKRINGSDDPSSTFTTDELKKLGQVLQLEDDKVVLLAQSLMHVWNQSIQVILKPADLQANLVDDLHLEAEKAEEFVKLWTERIKADCGDMDIRKKLESISWEINLQTASNFVPKESTPKVRLQMKLSDLVNAGTTENVILDLTEGELVDLYNVVENVQSKLDYIQNLSQMN